MERQVLVSRLLEFTDPAWCWNHSQITMDMIAQAVKDGVEPQSYPFGHRCQPFPIEQKSNQWHLGRIIWFINHPEEIRDIEIANEGDQFGIYPIPIVVDGAHRFAAAIYLDVERIHCLYFDEDDCVINYLDGTTDKL